MTLKQIRTAPTKDLENEEARIISLKNKGYFIGTMLKNRLDAIAKEMHKRNIGLLITKEKPVAIQKESRKLKEGEKLIPLEDYIYLNKKGKPCSRSWKHRLVKLDVEGISKAPFDYIIESDRTYIIVKPKN